jgi:hypothetical protein
MNDEEYRAIIEQSFQLNELTKHAGWPVLVDYMLSVKLRPVKERLLAGNIDSLDEYKKVSGFCAGAESVLNAHRVVADVVLREQERRDEKAAEV